MNTEIKSADTWDDIFEKYSKLNYLELEQVRYWYIPFKEWLKKNYQFAPAIVGDGYNMNDFEHAAMESALIIEKLKSECKRVKIERNNYEQELIYARRKISKLKAQIEARQPINRVEYKIDIVKMLEWVRENYDMNIYNKWVKWIGVSDMGEKMQQLSDEELYKQYLQQLKEK